MWGWPTSAEDTPAASVKVKLHRNCPAATELLMGSGICTRTRTAILSVVAIRLNTSLSINKALIKYILIYSGMEYDAAN